MNAVPVMAEIIGPDILIILVIVAVLFGSSRLPKLARSLGSAKSEFEKGVMESTRGAADQAPKADERVTLTKAELDAMIAEARGGGAAGPISSASPKTSVEKP